MEGYNNACNSLTITNSFFGPSGNSPTVGNQEKRDTLSTANATNVHTHNQWADGISLACQSSFVSGNTVIDATDGGIVLFGVPGSTITNNTIVSNSRVLMGGINMVDTAPFSGSFANVLVANNHLVANTTMMKVGIAMGTMVWSSYNSTSFRTNSGTVLNNTFSSGATGYFSYGM